MIICKGEEHHRSDLDFAVDGYRLVLDGVQAEDGGLWEVDDWSTHERAEDAAIADCERAAGHIFDCELVVAGLSGTKLAA